MNKHTRLHFTLSLTGVVNPLGAQDEDATDAQPMTANELNKHLYYAVNEVIIGNGLVTGDTYGTLESHDADVTVIEVNPVSPDDVGLSAEELEQKYSPQGGGEHPDFPREDWREMIRIEDTLLGYWAWVNHRLTTEQDAL